ncbi:MULTISPECIES: hypothetical protein [Paenarthrobacter]|uniref:Stability/partitioning determinant n=1 Tax=Paenarthrobacter ureafaciens TaxID=37931 RepID=A0AAX3EQY8_PAEUR|nr:MULTISPECIES: hypothetical protein [Paenarthrobacter]MDO5867112.1 hypothetical protein [Paenarthrobacter sp. SD-2]MDO5878366.1 hypothetical protein [Paenarthrobacter sp. SD-1]UYV95593.1 hypothetical protein NL395_23295 [Paenarthrobacter ureafaciens]UYW00277.1 hypothetical protein NL394_24105 [Paenarthrobacter ureafaciens]
MTKPELRSRRRPLDPEAEARIAAFSSTPDTAPEVAAVPPTPAVPAAAPLAEEAKSKGFNYRMTPTRHAMIDAMRKEDDRSFQWMLDKLIDLGMEAWKDRR